MRISDWSSDVCSSDLACMFDDQAALPVHAVEPYGRVIGEHGDARLLLRGAHDVGDIGILARQQARSHLDLTDLGPAPCKCLRQLAADRPAAQDRDTARQVIEPRKFVPQGIAGQITAVLYPRPEEHTSEL